RNQGAKLRRAPHQFPCAREIADRDQYRGVGQHRRGLPLESQVVGVMNDLMSALAQAGNDGIENKIQRGRADTDHFATNADGASSYTIGFMTLIPASPETYVSEREPAKKPYEPPSQARVRGQSSNLIVWQVSKWRMAER